MGSQRGFHHFRGVLNPSFTLHTDIGVISVVSSTFFQVFSAMQLHLPKHLLVLQVSENCSDQTHGYRGVLPESSSSVNLVTTKQHMETKCLHSAHWSGRSVQVVTV